VTDMEDTKINRLNKGLFFISLGNFWIYAFMDIIRVLGLEILVH